MSEFDRLMRQGSPSTKRKKAKKEKHSKRWAWAWLIAFVLAIIPPHIGVLFFIPMMGYWIVKASIEWLG